LRIVAVDRRSADAGGGPHRVAVVDRDAKMPGRGAYVCRASDPGDPSEAAGLADPACLERASGRGSIARALRSAVTLDPKLVESVIR
jgi:predicted RNA-binding protein YlxR (DUF448 family)